MEAWSAITVAVATLALAGCAVLGGLYRTARREGREQGTITARLDGIDRQLVARKRDSEKARGMIADLANALGNLDAYLRGKGHINGDPGK